MRWLSGDTSMITTSDKYVWLKPIRRTYNVITPDTNADESEFEGGHTTSMLDGNG